MKVRKQRGKPEAKTNLCMAVPLNVASNVKLLCILICRHITTLPVASLHRLMLNLQNGNENLSGDCE